MSILADLNSDQVFTDTDRLEFLMEENSLNMDCFGSREEIDKHIVKALLLKAVKRAPTRDDVGRLVEVNYGDGWVGPFSLFDVDEGHDNPYIVVGQQADAPQARMYLGPTPVCWRPYSKQIGPRGKGPWLIKHTSQFVYSPVTTNIPDAPIWQHVTEYAELGHE